MHLSNSKIIKSEEAETSVSEYRAKKIQQEMPRHVDPSNHFAAEFTGEAGSFRMDELLQERTGLSEKRQREVMSEVETKVVEKLSEVQEDAYTKAYNLGMEEGREEGLKLAEERVHQKLAELDQIAEELLHLRTEMVKTNEAGLVDLAFKLGSKIAMKEIDQDPAYIFDCVRSITDTMQMDTEVNLRVSEEDFNFINEFKDRDLRNKELFSKIKVFKEEVLNKGECIFDSNHGVVNATVDDRIEKLWQRLSESFPKSELEGTRHNLEADTTALRADQEEELSPKLEAVENIEEVSSEELEQQVDTETPDTDDTKEDQED